MNYYEDKYFYGTESQVEDPSLGLLKTIRIHELMQEYEHQIKNYGNAKFHRIQFGSHGDHFGGLKVLPSLKNVEFSECGLNYNKFGNFVTIDGKTINEEIIKEYNIADIKESIKEQTSKVFENVTFNNCSLFDVWFHGCKFNNLIFQDCEIINNSKAESVEFDGLKIYGDDKTFKDIAFPQFFNKCRIENSHITVPMAHPDFKRERVVDQVFHGDSNMFIKKPCSIYKNCVIENTKFSMNEV